MENIKPCGNPIVLCFGSVGRCLPLPTVLLMLIPVHLGLQGFTGVSSYLGSGPRMYGRDVQCDVWTVLAVLAIPGLNDPLAGRNSQRFT